MSAAATAIPSTTHFFRDGKRALRSVCPQFVLNWRERNYYARFGEVELHLVDILCQPERDAIDIGANDGCYIHFMRHHARAIYAFEPLPWLAEKLRQKFPGDVTIEEMALSDRSGSAVLHIPVVDGVPVTGCSTVSRAASSTYPALQSLTVMRARLDDLYGGDPGFIKVDVEGHEESVLTGAMQTIAARRPRLMLELVDRLAPGAINRVIVRLCEQGYAGFFLYQRQLLPAERFDIDVMQNDANYPDLTAGLEQRQRFGNYVYNFIFIPEEEAVDVSEQIRRRIATL